MRRDEAQRRFFGDDRSVQREGGFRKRWVLLGRGRLGRVASKRLGEEQAAAFLEYALQPSVLLDLIEVIPYA